MHSTKKSAQLAKYQRCWQAVHRGDLTELLDLAADLSLTSEMLATIAPNRDRDADVRLVGLVLDHPACSGGIASRYTTHHDAGIRLRVATFRGGLGAPLEMLALDTDERVREAAGARLKTRSGTTTSHGWR
jgi:hypothetical protein